jgi:hypothetical protein
MNRKTMVKIRILLITSSLSSALAGCGVTSQLHSELNFNNGTTIQAVDLDQYGIGVLTPSAPTGRESDKQALGDALGAAFEVQLPVNKFLPLGAMLSAINTSGLAGSYARMLSEYEATGILERDTIRQIADASGVRYLAKFNLGDFQQSRDKRLSIAGIRMFDTSRAIIRVHLEIWDGLTGEIAWQGNDELVFAREGVKEKPVSFSQVARLSADQLIEQVGETGSIVSDEEPEALVVKEVPVQPPVRRETPVLVSKAVNREAADQPSAAGIGL